MIKPEDILKKIPWSELSFEVTRSGGPGGQNVNRTNSAVVVSFNISTSTAFTDLEKSRLLQFLSSCLTSEGVLKIRAEESRDQLANKKSALNKLGQTLARGLFVPKKRIATKATRSSQRKRVEGKRLHSQIKGLRRPPKSDE